MVRIEHRKDGTIVIYANGMALQVPPVGEALVIAPSPKYHAHREHIKS